MTTPQPHSGRPRFFFDNNISQDIANGMAAFGEEVSHLLDVYGRGDVPDEDWLRDVGVGGLTIISRDRRIRRSPAEIGALKRFKVGGFWLGGKDLTTCQMIQQLVRNWPRMKELAMNTTRPFMYIVPPNGTKIDKLAL